MKKLFTITSLGLFVFLGNLKAQTVSTVAGSTQGYAEGRTSPSVQNALFNAPFGICYNGDGSVTVTDRGSNKIRKVTSATNTQTFAGSSNGYVNHTDPLQARFSGNIAGIARDASGNFYVADQDNHTIRKITPSGVVTTLAGTNTLGNVPVGNTSETGTTARFYNPLAIAIGPDGNLYVADASNHKIRKVTPAGVVSTYAGSGAQSGTDHVNPLSASFSFPNAIAIDAAGNVYVGEMSRIRKIDATTGAVTTFAGGATSGYVDATGTAARFLYIQALAVDAHGNLFVSEADGTNSRIRKVTPTGVVTTYAGGAYGDADGDIATARFRQITGLTIDPVTSILYMCDAHRIRKIVPAQSAPTVSNVNHVAGTTSATFYYQVNSGNLATTSVIKYGLNSGNLTQQTAGFAAPVNDLPLKSNASITGLLPSTTYYYQIEVTNSQGTHTSTESSFTTPSNMTAVHEFTFDNTLSNTSNNITFSGTPVYTINRFNEPNKALEVNGVATQRTTNITDIPLYGNNRSISLWYKVSSIVYPTVYINIFSYGNPTQYNTFGSYISGSKVYFQGNAYDVDVDHPLVANQWHHMVITFNAGIARIYINNQLVLEENRPLINTNFFGAKIGDNYIGAVDDLKIYNRALSATEITELFYAEQPVPTITGVSANTITANTATIAYSLNANNATTTSIVKYGLTNNNLSSQVAGFSATGNSPSAGTASLTGLQANTLYYYQIEATNGGGTSTSSILSFSTLASNAPSAAIAAYTFDGTLNSVSGNMPFTSIPEATYTADRSTNANKAVNLANKGTSATITGLSYGSTARTIAMWVKLNTLNIYDFNFLFHYGASQGNGAFINATKTVYFASGGGGSTLEVATTHAANTWYHYVFTYDGTTVKIYKDGVEIGSAARTWNTTNNSDIFTIGKSEGGLDGYFNGVLDDLKIYNYALSAAEVSYIANPSLLPVNLLGFTAKAQNNAAVLNWQTASETNNSHFVIKHSANGVDFVTLSNIAAKRANGASYQYTHNKAANGTNYYQLLQVDLDGKTNDLGVKVINFGLPISDIRLFPNPTTNQANVSFTQGAFHSAKLANVSGQVLQTTIIGKTQQTVTFSLGSYPNGVYFIRLQGNSHNSVQKVIKQ